jgi:UDP-perosamine 4-acetyltransferase
MKSKRVVVIGAGGHAAVVIEALQALGEFTIVGILDPHPVHPHVVGVPVLGADDRLPALREEGVEAAVVALGENGLRQKIGRRLLTQGYVLPLVIHPGAFVSPTATIEVGTVIMNRATVGARARIGSLVIINTGSIVEHDDEIGAAAHVAPGVALAGSVTVGERSLIGIGSAVRPGIHIGADAVIGAGSAVVADIGNCMTVVGNPARQLTRRAQSAS